MIRGDRAHERRTFVRRLNSRKYVSRPVNEILVREILRRFRIVLFDKHCTMMVSFRCKGVMAFRPYFWGFIAFTTVFFPGKIFVSAQNPTDFTPWKDAKNAESIPDWARIMLSRDFRDLTGTAREELLAKTLSALSEIASDSEVVPATRYNAILAAGQLEASLGSPGNPRTAYPATLTYLVDVYQQGDAPLFLKYGALLGIVRHALLGIDADQRDKVIDLLLETAASEFESGYAIPLEPAVWDWFRQTALDGLSALKTTGISGKVVAELLSIINDQSQELEEWSRSHQDVLNREAWQQIRRTLELASKAAKTLGDLDYPSATDIDTKKMTDTFIRLTKVACEVTCKMATDFIDREEMSPSPAVLCEQIVVNMKTCTQSVVWGMKSGFLTARPSENSFYASLKNDDPAIKRSDVLMAEIVELSAFFDEGDKARRSVALPGVPKAFKFDLSELRDALKKCSEALP